jgi:transcriptional regulator with XRE-family HTH domain
VESGQAPPFGALLRRYRIAAGLTQEELAERASLGRRSIGDLERAVGHRPRKDTVALLATALTLSPEDHQSLAEAARQTLRSTPSPQSRRGTGLMSVDHESFGALLKRHRAAAALPQKVLAEQAGLSLDAISALEAGRRGGPQLDTARRLADALGLAGEDRARFLAAAHSQAALASALPAPPERPAHGAGRHALPHYGGALIGREREVALAVQLVRPRVLLTLVGPGGVGKTRLAVYEAATVAGAFADGVVFVPLAALTDPSLVAATVAIALGLGERGGRPSHQCCFPP